VPTQQLLTQCFLTSTERGNPSTRLDARHREGAAWNEGNMVRPLIHGSTYFAEVHRTSIPQKDTNDAVPNGNEGSYKAMTGGSGRAASAASKPTPHSRRLGFDDRMASAGLRFQLATRSRLTLRGMERGLDLQVWPEAGFDNFYEAFSVRTWLGKSIEIGSVLSVCTRFAEILELYLSCETPPFASQG
jgi:hypothetical protein